MKNYRTLSSQAEAEIEALRYKGVTLSDSDIIAINALAWEIETPSKRVSLARGKPCKCGNVFFWPLTNHGGTFEMWERQCSIDYVRNFIDTTCKQDEADQKKTHRERSTLILARYTDSLLRKAKNGQ
jgi:hypothetical protein